MIFKCLIFSWFGESFYKKKEKNQKQPSLVKWTFSVIILAIFLKSSKSSALDPTKWWSIKKGIILSVISDNLVTTKFTAGALKRFSTLPQLKKVVNLLINSASRLCWVIWIPNLMLGFSLFLL